MSDLFRDEQILKNDNMEKKTQVWGKQECTTCKKLDKCLIAQTENSEESNVMIYLCTNA